MEEITGYKIRVATPDVSRIVQKKLFEMGYSWVSGKVVSYLTELELYVDISSKSLSWFSGIDPNFFDQHKYKEIYLDDLFLKDKLNMLDMKQEVLICSKCGKEIQSDQHYEDNHDGTYICMVCSIQKENAYIVSF